MDTTRTDDRDGFGRSRQQFDDVLAFLDAEAAAALTHAELEDQLATRGRELLRCLYQDHLDLRALREARLGAVADTDGVARGSVEADHQRALATIFGDVTVSRLAYRRRGRANLHPADAVLNLPAERYSHGLRRLAAVESTKGSFDDVTDAVAAATGVAVGKRQTEELTGRAAVDFDGFYQHTPRPSADSGDVLVISADGKGVVMRPDALRPATKAAADQATPKIKGRLSKGEKANRKRMATVGAVYDTTPVPRTPEQIFAGHDAPAGPTATGKWLTASVTEDTATVVSQIFDEAQRRDPGHQRTWVALVDGNNHQIARITAEASTRDVDVAVVIDFVHVLEYLWRAAWSFFNEGDPAAQDWVTDKAMRVLHGQSSTVAAAIRRKATTLGLTARRRANADTESPDHATELGWYQVRRRDLMAWV